MDKDILLLRSMPERCRARLALLEVDMQSPLVSQVTFVLLVTSGELPPGYAILHDVDSGRYIPRKDGQIIWEKGETVWYADETDARIYCWEQVTPTG